MMQNHKYTFLMFPTMLCNLRCKYCHFGWDKKVNGDKGYTWTGYGKAHYVESEVKPGDLIKFLDGYRPYKLEFSGGEPTIYPGFVDLVNAVPPDSLWAITSNIMCPTEVLEKINYSRCECWTVSWHKESKRFDDNLAILKTKTPVSVSIVVPFADVKEAISRGWHYKMQGYRVNLLRELNPEVDWTQSTEWDTVIEQRDYGFNVIESDIPPSFKFDRGYKCYGGSKYMAIMPDGKIYRCYSDAMRGEPIGDIWNFKHDPEPVECWAECLGCALDHAMRIQKIEIKESITTK